MYRVSYFLTLKSSQRGSDEDCESISSNDVWNLKIKSRAPEINSTFVISNGVNNNQ